MNDQNKATPMSKTTPETDEQIIFRDSSSKESVPDLYTKETVLKMLKSARLSERTRIMEEGRKGLFTDEEISILECNAKDEDLQKVMRTIRDQGAMLLASREEVHRKQMGAFVIWLLNQQLEGLFKGDATPEDSYKRMLAKFQEETKPKTDNA